MAKFTVNIPDELVPLMTETNGDPAEYIKTFLIKPLVERYEVQQKRQIIEQGTAQLDDDLKRMRKGVSIRIGANNA